MDQIINPVGSTELTRLDVLASEARIYSENLASNMIRLGRVFAEAKPLVKHGEWQNWLRENSGMSVRAAQNLMEIHNRFGNNPAFDGIQKSKLFKMLSLPEGTEEKFIAENNIDEMSARQVEAAVKQTRAEMQGEIERERALREDAEKRADALANRPFELPDEVAHSIEKKDELIKRQSDELKRLAEMGKETIEEAARLRKLNLELKRDMDDQAEILRDVQEECNRAQAELLNAQSTIAKGESDHVPTDELTADDFAAAVRQFIGVCARMPHMARTFAAMDEREKDVFNELLLTVESWATASRTAIDTYSAEEAIVL